MGLSGGACHTRADNDSGDDGTRVAAAACVTWHQHHHAAGSLLGFGLVITPPQPPVSLRQ